VSLIRIIMSQKQKKYFDQQHISLHWIAQLDSIIDNHSIGQPEQNDEFKLLNILFLIITAVVNSNTFCVIWSKYRSTVSSFDKSLAFLHDNKFHVILALTLLKFSNFSWPFSIYHSQTIKEDAYITLKCRNQWHFSIMFNYCIVTDFLHITGC
jgi:hypothetical protein